MAKTAQFKGARAPRNRVFTSPETPETPIVPATVPEPSDQADKIERFAIPLDPKSGAIVLDNMRDASREKLIKALAATPNLAPNTSPGASADDAALNAILASVLYDAVSSIAIVVARSRGFSASAASLLRYTDEEKQSFIAPTAAVLDKYDFLKGKYKEEILLLTVVGAVTGSKIMAMQKAEAMIVAAPAPGEPS